MHHNGDLLFWGLYALKAGGLAMHSKMHHVNGMKTPLVIDISPMCSAPAAKLAGAPLWLLGCHVILLA